MSALFAYGTLLFPEVLRAVTGRALTPRAAALHGYRRHGVAGEIFPAMIEGGEADTVSGVLYHGLDDGDWRRLDRFEGELYRRRAVTVRCAASGAAGAAREETVTAFTYVLDPASHHRLEAADWDPDAFTREHLEHFVTRLRSAGDPRAVE